MSNKQNLRANGLLVCSLSSAVGDGGETMLIEMLIEHHNDTKKQDINIFTQGHTLKWVGECKCMFTCVCVIMRLHFIENKTHKSMAIFRTLLYCEIS